MNEKVVNKIVQGQAFGEISLIHNSARTATIKTLSDQAALWGVQRQVFRSAASGVAAPAVAAGTVAAGTVAYTALL